MTISRRIRKIRIRLVTLDQLPVKLLELLTIAPRTKHELAALTGWSTDTVQKHLINLRNDQFIYAKGISVNKGGIQDQWCVGDAPQHVSLSAKDLPKPPSYSEMKQCVVQQYDIHSFRHPMDVALFGPARREAA